MIRTMRKTPRSGARILVQDVLGWPWPDISAQNEKFNRTELDDSALQLEEPVWGEDIELLKH